MAGAHSSQPYGKSANPLAAPTSDHLHVSLPLHELIITALYIEVNYRRYLGSWVGARQPLPADAGAILDLTCELPLRPKYRCAHDV